MTVNHNQSLPVLYFLPHQGLTIQLLFDPGVPGVWSMGPDVCLWVSEWCFWNLADVSLADQATNSKPTDNSNMAIQGNVAM